MYDHGLLADYCKGIDSDLLVIPAADHDVRELLVNLLLEQLPGIHWNGCWCDTLPYSGYNKHKVKLQCQECKCDRFWPATYHRGYLPSNKDEYYTAKCKGKRCGAIIRWEPTYDSDEGVSKDYGPNCIVLNAYLRPKCFEKPPPKYHSDTVSNSLQLILSCITSDGTAPIVSRFPRPPQGISLIRMGEDIATLLAPPFDPLPQQS